MAIKDGGRVITRKGFIGWLRRKPPDEVVCSSSYTGWSCPVAQYATVVLGYHDAYVDADDVILYPLGSDLVSGGERYYAPKWLSDFVERIDEHKCQLRQRYPTIAGITARDCLTCLRVAVAVVGGASPLFGGALGTVESHQVEENTTYE